MDKKKLVNIMADKGLTQAELAEKAGVSRTAIYGAMKGRTPRLNTLGKIAKVLGVKPSELLDM
ncbi:helix-turn-helix domain-containing protein [Selenomonas montiformis]|nr:helix-turn-helix transcriptional regulator [Selenomonas montiformis]